MASTNHIQAAPVSRPDSAPGITIAIRWERIPWEPLLYLALVAIAASMRFWDLGARAFHYDETIHAFDSWRLYGGDGYVHSPWSHGPFLYELTAGGFLLFGDSNVTPRVFPALFGSALVVMPVFLRGYLGRWGALATAALLAFSPSLLYFSRFSRQDIFTVVFDLGVVIAFWKYVETRRNLFLYLAAVFLVLGLSSNETTFLSLAALLSFLGAWWARGWLPALWSGAGNRLARLRRRLGPSALPSHGTFLLFIFLLALPLFSAGIGYAVDKVFHPGFTLVVPQTAGEPAGRVGAPDGSAASYTIAALIAATLFVTSFVAGVLWKGKTFAFAFLGFYAIFFLLHTTFLTNMVGLGTGVWQSLGYWIAQQPVQRGSQPWYYYFILLSVYEFLPFTFGLAAIAIWSSKRGRVFLLWVVAVAAAAGGLAVALSQLTDSKVVFLLAPLGGGLMVLTYRALGRGDIFEWFLVHWALVTLLLYVVAGEKMPWLLVHITLPFALLAGRLLGRAVEAVSWKAVLRRGGAVLLFAGPVAVIAGLAIASVVNWDKSPIGAWSFIGAVGFAAALAAAGVWLWARLGTGNAARVVAVSVLAVMGFFTIRAGTQATYANADDPKEVLVYSQLGPGVPLVVRQIETRARELGKGKEISILADTSQAALAPWRWYLRDYKKVQFVDMTSYTGLIDADVVLLSDGSLQKIEPVKARYGNGQRVQFLEWFNPGAYSSYSAGQLLDDFTSAASLRRLRDFFVYREIGSRPAVQDAVVFFAKGGV